MMYYYTLTFYMHMYSHVSIQLCIILQALRHGQKELK